MNVILKAGSGEEILLEPGTSLTIGRDPQWCDHSFESDPLMSPVHFRISVDKLEVSVRDLNSRAGTWVNDARQRNAVLRPGDRITAGQTTFILLLATAGAQKEEVDLESGKASEDDFPASPVLDEMSKLSEPLYALLDLARDPQILEILGEAGADGQSLFEGDGAEKLITVAPHLVALDKESLLLEDLLRKGWGQSWGYYLTSPQGFQPLRRHLRQFLMVADEANHKLYFRFYDPRVLRLYLPTCNLQEATQFFGSVTRFWVEDEDPGTLLEFTRNWDGIRCRRWPLRPAAEEGQAKEPLVSATPATSAGMPGRLR